MGRTWITVDNSSPANSSLALCFAIRNQKELDANKYSNFYPIQLGINDSIEYTKKNAKLEEVLKKVQ